MLVFFWSEKRKKEWKKYIFEKFSCVKLQVFNNWIRIRIRIQNTDPKPDPATQINVESLKEFGLQSADRATDTLFLNSFSDA
jgi:hypothetical protein